MIFRFRRPAAPCARLCLALLLAGAAPAGAATHVIAPPDTPVVTANSAATEPDLRDGGGDGSPARPWPSLAAALASGRVKAGDELRLQAGDYGDLAVRGASFDAPVVIAPAAGAQVHVTSLMVTRSRNLEFRDLQIWPTAPGKGHLVKTDGRSAQITFRGLDIRGREDAAGYPRWTRDDWAKAKRAGILMAGPDNALIDSRFTGLAFGIGTTGARARVEGNVIRGFSGDGIRGLGDGSVFLRNRIEDCVQVDGNHADGFQSWSRGDSGRSGRGTVHGLRIEGNVFLEWASPVVSPLRCSLQGIGMFDGMYEDVVIRNNLLAISAPHGITVSGGIRVEITHNTVINNRAPHRKFPWIRVSPHKNDTPARDALIANNIATILHYNRKPEARMTVQNNLLQTPPARIFVDPAKGDFRPRPGGPADGTAAPGLGAAQDLFGRPRGARPDIGAIEND